MLGLLHLPPLRLQLSPPDGSPNLHLCRCLCASARAGGAFYPSLCAWARERSVMTVLSVIAPLRVSGPVSSIPPCTQALGSLSHDPLYAPNRYVPVSVLRISMPPPAHLIPNAFHCLKRKYSISAVVSWSAYVCVFTSSVPIHVLEQFASTAVIRGSSACAIFIVAPRCAPAGAIP